MNADKFFVFHLRLSAFIGGYHFFSTPLRQQLAGFEVRLLRIRFMARIRKAWQRDEPQ